ncbi:hypothetical protein O6H91_03G130000 [Diphasiastrum complanatum]|uniref:Uncharacterized protein n=1 Tax=Diphasiastrum complanatum TaxID=34168 RepID=A0ACC2EBC8_DIPCM|nr:hypothetical protein O6H91_03G130000 [Diphasiastrum complanatum]
MKNPEEDKGDLDLATLLSDCRRFLTEIESDIQNSSLTFHAVQRAVYLLQTLENESSGGGVIALDTDALSYGENNAADTRNLGKPSGAVEQKESTSASVTVGLRSNSKDGRTDAPPTQNASASPTRHNLEAPCSEPTDCQTLDMEDFIGSTSKTNEKMAVSGEVINNASGSKRKAAVEIAKAEFKTAKNPKNSAEDAEKVPGDLRPVSKAENIATCSSRGVGSKKPETSKEAMGRRSLIVNRWSMEEALAIADKGEAGVLLEDRVQYKLASPGRVALTSLISQCLLVSMDQNPFHSLKEAEQSSAKSFFAAPDFKEHEDLQLSLSNTPIQAGVNSSLDVKNHLAEKTVNGDAFWLYKWLVIKIFSGRQSGAQECTETSVGVCLDWLVAYLTIANPDVLAKLLLDQLVEDLLECHVKGCLTLVPYLNRVAIFEFAVQRLPEEISTILLSLLPYSRFPVELQVSMDKTQEAGIDKTWMGCYSSLWIVLFSLCPKLLETFIHVWLPTFTIDEGQSWWKLLQGSQFRLVSLPKPWAAMSLFSSQDIMLGRRTEVQAWLCTMLEKRLAQVSTVGTDIVLFLACCSELSATSVEEQQLNVGQTFLAWLCRKLSLKVLPNVLGGHQDEGEDDTRGSDVAMFLENLKENVHRLWHCTLCSSSQNNETIEQSQYILNSFESSRFKTSNIWNFLKNHESSSKDLFKICQLTMICCDQHVVADLLAAVTCLAPDKSVKANSLQKLYVVLRMMHCLGAVSDCWLVFDIWAERVVSLLNHSNSYQALSKILALRQLLEPGFWCDGSPTICATETLPTVISTMFSEDENENIGLAAKSAWQLMYKALNGQWLQLLMLLHKDDAFELKLNVLDILYILNIRTYLRPQAISPHLKGVLGLYFFWLKHSHVHGGCSQSSFQDVDRSCRFDAETWQLLCLKEKLKRVIIQLSGLGSDSFMLMVDCLLDFSFEEGFCNQLGKSIIFDGMQNEAHPAMFMKSLATARITRDGKYEAVMGTGFQVALEQGSEKPYTSMLLENCRRKLGKLSEKDDKRVFSSSCDMAAATTKTRILKLELGSILHLSFERAITIMSESLQERNVWALPPSSILATLLVNRLETPHEMSLTMEQYEEVLPKQVCAQRHIFLTECFSYNPLLFEVCFSPVSVWLGSKDHTFMIIVKLKITPVGWRKFMHWIMLIGSTLHCAHDL